VAPVHILVCGHVFRVQCIERVWSFVRSTLPRCCAVCRRVIHLSSPRRALPPGTTVINVDEEQMSFLTTGSSEDDQFSQRNAATRQPLPPGTTVINVEENNLLGLLQVLLLIHLLLQVMMCQLVLLVQQQLLLLMLLLRLPLMMCQLLHPQIMTIQLLLLNDYPDLLVEQQLPLPLLLLRLQVMMWHLHQ